MSARVAACCALVVTVAVAACGSSVPDWLKKDGRATLKFYAGPHATPTRERYVIRPHRAVAIYNMGHAVVCHTCSTPAGAPPVTGQVFRFAYDPTSHKLLDMSLGPAR